MADDTLGTISIGLGLDVKDLRTQAEQARTVLNEVFPPGKPVERTVRFTPQVGKLPAGAISAAVKEIKTALNTQLKGAMALTPRFTITKVAASALRRDIETKFKVEMFCKLRIT